MPIVWLVAIPGLWLAVVASPAAAADGATRSRPFFSCDNDYRDFADLAASEESMDLYHGLAFIGGAAGLSFGGSPTRRWSGTNDFDTGIREGLRLGSPSAREDADLLSDLGLGITTAVLPFASIARKFATGHDCVETWDMFTDAIESFGLAVFLSEAVKLASGRERPFFERCDEFPPRDAGCSSDDRNRSFFSGHASLAAAGAGLTCSYAIKRDAWGSSRTAHVTPCAVGIVAALATGTLRVVADRHWTSDVLAGFAIGAVVGYFDTWGPLDLLEFETRDVRGDVSARGIVLPQIRDGRIGFQLSMTF